jgi:hypothetical protein
LFWTGAALRYSDGLSVQVNPALNAGFILSLLMQRLTAGGKDGFMHGFRKRWMSKDHR